MNRAAMLVLCVLLFSSSTSGCSLLIEKAVPECQHRIVLPDESRSAVLDRMGTPATIEDGDKLVDTFKYSEADGHCSIWHGLSGGNLGASGGYGPGAGGLVIAVIAIGETVSYAAMVYDHFKEPDHEMTVYYDAGERVVRSEVTLLPQDNKGDSPATTAAADTSPTE
ncbi:MAG TPA: hypothetical protein VLI44_01090 [Sporolactobacillaceae bacterium]|nr:hypothetical protein [Sporolactobacillaceae bacterium]